MDIVHTQGRKSLPVGEWVKAELSQGASNCVTARLADGAVQMDDTQNPGAARLSMDPAAWGAALKALA